MQIDKEMLKSLLSLDDNTLKNTLSFILPKFGLNLPPEALDNIGGIRTLISLLSVYDDTDKALASLEDKELAEKIRGLYGK